MVFRSFIEAIVLEPDRPRRGVGDRYRLLLIGLSDGVVTIIERLCGRTEDRLNV